SPLETILHVLNREPVPPSCLEPQVPRDLETICLTCLAKETHHRYPSAEALADDLDRYLADRPIRARRTPFWLRGLKWARRRPASCGLLAAALLVGSILMVVTRDRERKLAELRQVGDRVLIRASDHLLDGRYSDEDEASLHELKAKAA